MSFIVITLIAGCGGGSSSPTGTSGTTETFGTTEITETKPLVSKVASTQQASALLSRATFGARAQEIESLATKGNYDQWFEAEFAKMPSYHIAWIENNTIGVNGVGDLKDNPENWRQHSDMLTIMQQDAWWDIVVNGDDQLRQRVAFALSEIMVISRFGPLVNNPDSRMSYYDLLVKNAFGNFETLLQDVTYHPAMGRYLSYLGNGKADPEKGNHPDENYAREVMQLFTIGLYQLNLDGSKKLGTDGQPLPTYDQTDIEEMAKVFTGLSSQNDYFGSRSGASTYKSRTAPMVAYDKYHQEGEKVILGQTISGSDTKTDINKALNILFNHSNTGPFIAKRLIQRLVTSNPSADYIGRVSMAFNDNGQGKRGDMKAVIKAILLDEEAFDGDVQTSGKVREPLLFVSNLFRAFHAKNDVIKLWDRYQYSAYNFHGTGYLKQQSEPLAALTVFNYFTPDDAPYSLKKEGLVAPEFKVFGKGLHQVLMGLINKNGFVYRHYNITAELQLDTEKSLLEAKKYDELLDHLDTLLLAGKMSDYTKSAIKSYIEQHENLESDILARYVIGLVMTSPDYAVQR